MPKVEAAIKNLSESDVRQLSTWLQEYFDEMRYRQIEAALALDQSDKLIAKAETDIAANRVKDLDEVLHNI